MTDYADQIDFVINDNLDFFYTIAIQSKTLTSLYGKKNFVEDQATINTLWDAAETHLKSLGIEAVVQNEFAMTELRETVKKYITLFTFILLGINYDDTLNGFISNVIEFNKTQSKYRFKAQAMFNSDANSKIFEYVSLLKIVFKLAVADKDTYEVLIRDPVNAPANKFYLSLNPTFHEALRSTDVYLAQFTLVKIFIAINIYRIHERESLFNLLETLGTDNSDFIYIDILVPGKKVIDFSLISDIYKSQHQEYLGNYVWDFLNDQLELTFETDDLTPEDKLNCLLESQIIMPITDEFLLYNSPNEMYAYAHRGSGRGTKLQYIINKINQASELYTVSATEKKNTLQNIFYTRQRGRKAVAINQLEDVALLNKYSKAVTLQDVEIQRLVLELLDYMEYPYVNFNGFQDAGMGLVINHRAIGIRKVSFDTTGPFQQATRSTLLQLRMARQGTTLNIVGFVIPQLRDIRCTQLFQTVNVADVESLSLKNKAVDGNDSENYDYVKFVTLLKELLLQNHLLLRPWHEQTQLLKAEEDMTVITETTSESASDDGLITTLVDNPDKVLYWLFQSDAVVTATQLSQIYDVVVGFLLDNLFEQCETVTEVLTPWLVEQFVTKYLQHFRKFRLSTKSLEEFTTRIYSKLFTVTSGVYDQQADVVRGLNDGKLVSTTSAPSHDAKRTDATTLRLEFNKHKAVTAEINRETKAATDADIVTTDNIANAICQHNITWEHIMRIGVKDIDLYMTELNLFLGQYIVVTADRLFICKSCGHEIDMKEFELGTDFDDDNKPIIHNVPIVQNLGDLQKYRKYSDVIIQLEKIIERIASVVNVGFYQGRNASVRNNIKNLLKSTIDLTIENGVHLRKYLKKRDELVQWYGVKENSRFFVFELTDDLYKHTVTNKDKYQNIKRDMMLIYLSLMMIFNLNDKMLYALAGRGKCDFHVFEAHYKQIFRNYRIRIDLTGKTAYILKYPTLCYAIFTFSCNIIAVNQWMNIAGLEDKKPKEKIRFLTTIIISTFIDALNATLEMIQKSHAAEVKKSNEFRSDSKLMYKTLGTKIFKKLTTIFSNPDVYHTLRKFKHLQRSKKKHATIEKGMELISVGITGNQYANPPKPAYRVIELPARIFYPRITLREKFYSFPCNVTNCPDGHNHVWQYREKQVICRRCQTLSRDLQFDKSGVTTMVHNYRHWLLNDISQLKCCIDGFYHSFIDQQGNSTKDCTKCHQPFGNINYTNEQLAEMDANVTHNRLQDFQQLMATITHTEERVDNDREILREARSNLKQHKHTVDTFIQTVKETVGDDLGIVNKLEHSSYLFDHDYQGNKLSKKLLITEDKITLTVNHSFFDRTVISYSSNKPIKLKVFYDVITHQLLGYWIQDKGYKHVKKYCCFEVIYSIKHMLTFMGLPSQYVNIRRQFELLSFNGLISTKLCYRNIHLRISEYQVRNLKQFVTQFLKMYTRALNNLMESEAELDAPEENIYATKLRQLTLLLHKELTVTSKIDYRPFGSWRSVEGAVHAKAPKAEVIETSIQKYGPEIVNTKLYADNGPGAKLRNYIAFEMTRLITSYVDKYSKGVITRVLLKYIAILFDMTTETMYYTDREYRLYDLIINSSIQYFREIAIYEEEVENLLAQEATADETSETEEVESIMEFDIEQAEKYDMEEDDIPPDDNELDAIIHEEMEQVGEYEELDNSLEIGVMSDEEKQQERIAAEKKEEEAVESYALLK